MDGNLANAGAPEGVDRKSTTVGGWFKSDNRLEMLKQVQHDRMFKYAKVNLG